MALVVIANLGSHSLSQAHLELFRIANHDPHISHLARFPWLQNLFPGDLPRFYTNKAIQPAAADPRLTMDPNAEAMARQMVSKSELSMETVDVRPVFFVTIDEFLKPL